MKAYLDQLFEVALAILMGFAVTCIGVLTALTLFGQKPDGYYIKAMSRGHVSNVYQTIKWGPDRLIFTGPNSQAWQVLYFVENPGLLVPPLPRNKQADL